jgi:hypothetical protein
MSKHYTFENGEVIEKIPKQAKATKCSSVINQIREESSKKELLMVA